MRDSKTRLPVHANSKWCLERAKFLYLCSLKVLCVYIRWKMNMCQKLRTRQRKVGSNNGEIVSTCCMLRQKLVLIKFLSSWGGQNIQLYWTSVYVRKVDTDWTMMETLFKIPIKQTHNHKKACVAKRRKWQIRQEVAAIWMLLGKAVNLLKEIHKGNKGDSSEIRCHEGKRG